MARMLQSLRRALGLTSPKPVPTFRRSIDTDFSVFRGMLILHGSVALLRSSLITKLERLEGDRAIIHGKTPSLTKPLQPGQKTDLRRGYLEHSNIIGRRVRERIQAQKGQHDINWSKRHKRKK